MDEQSSLLALFTSSFLAATLLPGGSEAVLVSVLMAYPELYSSALSVATLGNTLGGMSSYVIGRLLPDEEAMRSKIGNKTRGLEWTRRYGAPILFLSWLPLIGDVLCVAAGWLRIHWLWAVIFIAVGKFARYWVIASVIG
ncbi:YqaA family protein [Nitrosomonas sp. Nm33]|uniref:YqaA family protein n=1 Tax=Nitrosomonas sp. Nm33 TaxID=133724 RepID=UPI00089D7CF4|nr:YqaA family protein [Nitrosomonas sp. Nm33]SDY48259.1 membrane protein YqaA, SNARE-associated domain [Nitrosomonas sp. Nm33]